MTTVSKDIPLDIQKRAAEARKALQRARGGLRFRLFGLDRVVACRLPFGAARQGGAGSLRRGLKIASLYRQRHLLEHRSQQRPECLAQCVRRLTGEKEREGPEGECCVMVNLSDGTSGWSGADGA